MTCPICHGFGRVRTIGFDLIADVPCPEGCKLVRP